MALKDGSTYYTKIMIVENGDVTVRRIHCIESQFGGEVLRIEGKNLPDYITFKTGSGHRDLHIATFLGAAARGIPLSKIPRQVGFWPTHRDWVYLVIGCMLPIMASAMMTLLAAAF